MENKLLAFHSQKFLKYTQYQETTESISVSSAQNFVELKRNEHVCKVCSQSFTYKHNLKAHYRLHTGEKPYICKICKKEYTFYPSLKNHLLSAHYSVLSKCNDGNQKQQLKLLLSKKR